MGDETRTRTRDGPETRNRTINRALERVLNGERLDRTDGLALYAQPVDQLVAAGSRLRAAFGDGTVDACSIVNAKAGSCAEDCGFCAQSVHFDTGIETYGFIGPERVLDAARQAERDGAQRFGIVVAEKGVSKDARPEEWAEVLEAIRLVREECSLEIDASLGILTEDEARILADEGVNHYNHNIETSPRYFPEIVSSHSFDDRVETLEIAKEAGMDLCAGVILGMGETPADRVDAAIALQEIGVASLPVNVLNPIDGTPLAAAGTRLTTDELLKTIAVYRFLHPDARIRLTGGREVALDSDEQHRPLEAGADGLLTGDYLTTDGQSAAEDLAVVERAGLEPNTDVTNFDPAAVRERPSSTTDRPSKNDTQSDSRPTESPATTQRRATSADRTDRDETERPNPTDE